MLSVELDSIKVQPASDLMAGLVREGGSFRLNRNLPVVWVARQFVIGLPRLIKCVDEKSNSVRPSRLIETVPTEAEIPFDAKSVSVTCKPGRSFKE